MTTSVRKLKGWPPKPGAIPETTEAKAARIGLANSEAADVLQSILNLDDRDGIEINDAATLAAQGDAGLSTKQRWALHLAIGVLKAGPR